ncbi:pyridoxamine 5'-phosphate oxidase family protein [Maribacter sp. HTCC2170]|uniref:pyridoxamine 5'-phosphate oxidase family protein n=1 Tax=Maribacter sp. (strain HTCC2170 / KCCM 42371) TaxID=313603 RepID=UPI000302EF24|nr:pyridoxamine 5'-phosphate oxidase family protein [Maribacter sp. HTCC2170]
MADRIFEKIKQELKKGAFKKGHYFKYFTLATLGVDKYARLRLVALRNVSEDLKLTFFTDKRSKKVLHIKENNKVSLLFYHHKKLVQLRIEGLAKINNDQFEIKKNWAEVGAESKKDYLTKKAPGTSIKSPENLEYLKEGDFFSIVEIEPFRIEYLKLKKNGHSKIKFDKTDKGWSSEYLVP